jgi:hypothetical protein
MLASFRCLNFGFRNKIRVGNQLLEGDPDSTVFRAQSVMTSLIS